MNLKPTQPWIPIDRIANFVQIEPALVIVGLALGSWLGYKLLLRGAAEHRHRNLRALFNNLAGHLAVFTILFIAYLPLQRLSENSDNYARLASYVGLLSILSGATVFVKTWRILVFEYLFLSHMRVAVPVLLVNLSTLLLSVFLTGWIGTEILNIRLAPLLATSAIFSVVLGLALQDTLGNLFAGVALQFDKPYEIGDWIEIEGPNGDKWTGQVHEITWRATTLFGWGDETITVPNKVMSQAQVSNFATRARPVVRRQTFRIQYGTPIDEVKSALLRGATRIKEVRRDPAPTVLAIESAESWVAVRLVYFVDDFGAQFVIGDKVICECLRSLQEARIELAQPRVQLTDSRSSNEKRP